MKKSCLQLIFLVVFLLVAADLQQAASAILPSDQTMPPVPPFVALERYPCLKWYGLCQNTSECSNYCACAFCIKGKCCCKC
ncbi:hypothetical protein AQUCO_00200990v1 [Aquilegia coerulea]|uniref:Knottin scorpion toxin-like domain-containing protein n=1 Tax=Aquilegia coerulea TaxID=218851 RepID=A0A2G5F5S9_AQUCA|nr:hypothetical protein AQUCO_00200990v1 [Aquilegia coerulea]